VSKLVGPVLPAKERLPALFAEVDNLIATSVDPAEVMTVESRLDMIERAMQEAAVYSPDEVREVNEFRMRARRKLGALLATFERATGPGRGHTEKITDPQKSFMAFLREIGLDKMRASEAQRIAMMPEPDFEKALTANHKAGVLNSIAGLVRAARPWWYKAARQRAHATIIARAHAAAAPDNVGPFPLLYADPPWKFDTYSDLGMERSPERHYPTLTDDEIADYTIAGKRISEIVTPAAALFMWCTSSNIHRALKIIPAWGFEFGTSAVWVKDKIGLGYIFRERHELLLYASRGNMPMPQYAPGSVFEFPRLEHSAKPISVRAEIERMYPDFDECTRAELFARVSESIPGWSCFGFEAFDQAAV
jgi:N6-adenosine-specific RNA methylase IME4